MSFKRVINVVETHDGEPMRVVTGGVGHIPGTVYMRWRSIYDCITTGCASSCFVNQEDTRQCAVTLLFPQSTRMRQQGLSLWSRPNIP